MKYNLLVLFIFSALISCNNDDDQKDCPSTFETAYVESVSAPSSGVVNEIIPMEVFFYVWNGCGIFNKFEENIEGNLRTIVLNAEYECRACTQAVERKMIIYNFSASTPGDYGLKFKSEEDEFFLVNITIQ